ncbi:MAG: response regulator [Lachnospiraceae bacterium]|nr:response regulator [Lachnospiraceae bacterium]
MRYFVIVFLLLFAAALVFWLVRRGMIIRRQYRELARARDEAEQAGGAKNRFLANISQDILTPINTIMGLDQMILRADAKDVPKEYLASVTAYAAEVKKASEALMVLVGDLLELSRLESEGLSLSEREYDVREMLLPLLSAVKGRCAAKGLEFKAEVDEMLPGKMYGDVSKIRQILLSLLINAVKYTDMGKVMMELSMEERTDMQCVLRFRITDTGMGMKKEDLDRIRRLLEETEGRNGPVFGTVSGLGISARYASILRGKLSCESTYGEGTEFSFRLPQKIEDASPIGSITEEEELLDRASYVPQFIAPDCDVLIADDDPVNLEVIRGLLQATKVFVTTALTGEECLQKVRNARYHVVILGHLSSGYDGWETLRRIRAVDEKLPVYALTAKGREAEEEYLAGGFSGQLAKPVDVRELERIIMRHIPESMMEKRGDKASAGTGKEA